MTSNPLDSHTTLLKQHRAILFKQLRDITSTIKSIDALLSGDPLTNPTTYTVNDKVISLSAPNKDRVGLVTKVTPSFIHVAPINTRFTPFKKSTENLAHFPLRDDTTDLDIYILRANTSPEQPPPSTTSSSIIRANTSPEQPPPSTTPSSIILPPSSPPYFSASDESTDTTLSPPFTTLASSTSKQTSIRRFIPPTQSTLSPTTKSRTKYRSKTTRKTSLARSARCARPDTRPPSRKRPKR